jgi:ParB/RepB/Spo0J family partition protein
VAETVEIDELDTRYERYRLASPGAEKILLCSIRSYGIRDPLQGVDIGNRRVLLDGFKRYRCAKSLHIHSIPYRAIGSDEAMGILTLIRNSNAQSLTIIEQARLINELRDVYKINSAEIAAQLERSASWVSMRVGLLHEMSETVVDKILKGEFPTYSYMYTLRQFIRMNCVSRNDIDEFVKAVSGKHLSIRDIEILARGYFKGGEMIRQQIQQGNISWSLSQLKESESTRQDDCSEMEQGMIRDLELAQKYMQRVTCKCKDNRLTSNSYFAQANLLTGGILRQMDIFTQAIKELYDTTGQKSGDL